MIPTVTRRLEWDAAHRVLKHESKCATLHGHHYVALITCEASSLDDCDRVIDFGVIKERVGTWIDENLDHTTIVNWKDNDLIEFCKRDELVNGRRRAFIVNGEPTAETLAEVVLRKAHSLLHDTGVRVTAVEIYETPNCSAKVTAAR